MPEGRANTGRLRAFAGKFKGQRCFIMGNGPSLLHANLNLLAEDITIVSNAHYLIWDRLTYVPTFLTVEDQLVAEDRASELDALTAITRLYPFDLRALLGAATATRLYVNFPRTYDPFPRFSFDLVDRAFWGGTVSFLNLQLAAYLGCDPIILIGFDHDYVVPSKHALGGVIHSEAQDVNHIHPDYFGPGYRWHDPNVERMESAYRCARHELQRAGTTVLNATHGGKLEVFDRMAFEAIT